MMSPEKIEAIQQLDSQLACSNQNWLLGAGISCEANIPLMGPLTGHVFQSLKETDHNPLLTSIRTELPKSAHIEHFLSQITDYIALAERSLKQSSTIGGKDWSSEQLKTAHQAVLTCISSTIRWGVVPATADGAAILGSHEHPVVNVDRHIDFVNALFFTRQAGLQDRRKPIKLFTTNYDTLIEDALALAGVPYYDGFSGGGVAFWHHRFGDAEPEAQYRASLIKLHGSIDWRIDDVGRIRRVRFGDEYPKGESQVLIHPQATKYLATQRDPFATQFDRFRRALNSTSDNILVICGYSFGDEHINSEIELAMQSVSNKTTILAFVKETDGEAPECLKKWGSDKWGKRLYVATDARLFAGAEVLFESKEELLDWWTFRGLTRFLEDGISTKNHELI